MLRISCDCVTGAFTQETAAKLNARSLKLGHINSSLVIRIIRVNNEGRAVILVVFVVDCRKHVRSHSWKEIIKSRHAIPFIYARK